MSALNTAAILHSRSGDTERAESFYTYGLGTTRRGIFLRNYNRMLSMQGRDDEAQQLKDQYSEEVKSGPSFWLAQAKKTERAGALKLAI